MPIIQTPAPCYLGDIWGGARGGTIGFVGGRRQIVVSEDSLPWTLGISIPGVQRWRCRSRLQALEFLCAISISGVSRAPSAAPMTYSILSVVWAYGAASGLAESTDGCGGDGVCFISGAVELQLDEAQ